MDYPLGAKNDPRAPYNEVCHTVSVCVSVTYHKTIDVEVYGAYDIDALTEVAKYEVENDVLPLEQNGWIQDEIEVVEE